MKPVFEIGHAFNTQDKVCVMGVPVADFDMANIQSLVIQDKAYKVLGFETSTAIWGSVNVHYLIDAKNPSKFENQIAYIDDDKFYRELGEPATVDSLSYFK